MTQSQSLWWNDSCMPVPLSGVVEQRAHVVVVMGKISLNTENKSILSSQSKVARW